MSDDTRDDREDPRLLSGAYSLDAVSEEEFLRFQAAAASSPDLRQEADELAETAGILALAASPVQPSDRMKIDLMAKIGATPQLPPLNGSTLLDGPAAVPAPAPSSGLDLPVPLPSSASGRAHTRWFTRPLGIAATAAAGVALFVAGGFVGSALTDTGIQNGGIEASASDLAAIYAASDVQRASAPIAGGGNATVVWSVQLRQSAVVAEDLPALPPGKVYEAWYLREAQAAAAGTFTPSSEETSWHVLDGAMSAGDAIGVTIEPEGGSEAPTTDPILVLPTT